MELNLQILKEDLKPLEFESYYSNRNCDLTCSFPLLYIPGMSFSPEPVYIARSADLPLDPNVVQRLTILCIGEPAPAYLQNPISILYTRDLNIDPFILLDHIINLFERYESWRKTMEESLSNPNTLYKIGHVSLPILKNPIYASTAGFKCLFHVASSDNMSEAEYRNFLDAYGGRLSKKDEHLPLEIMNALILDSEYNRAIEADEPTIYPGNPFGFSSLFCNIGVRNSYTARVLVDEIDHEFTDKDFALIKILSTYIDRALRGEALERYDRSKELDDMLNGLLEHKLLSEKSIVSTLWNMGWNIRDRFFCMVMESGDKTRSWTSLNAVVSQILAHQPSTCHIVFEKRSILIHNLSQSHLKMQEFLRETNVFFRDNLLISGISYEFDDFKDLYYYYNQAVAALNIGKEIDNTLWCFHYEDYALLDMIRMCKGEQIKESFYPKGIRSLHEYDEEMNADLVNLLRLYLQHNMSVTATTQAAFLHRNTCMYRLNRIREISGLDLEDPKVRLKLMIVFEIMEL